MSEFKNPIFWLALLVWGLAMLLSVASVWAVSGFDARTWPALTLEPAWTGLVSQWSQTFFVGFQISAYVLLITAGLLWGKVFEKQVAKSISAKVALVGGILSTGGFVLNGASWRITMWLEDGGYYVVRPNVFDLTVNMVSLCAWVFGGLTFIIFSILAANKLGKR